MIPSNDAKIIEKLQEKVWSSDDIFSDRLISIMEKRGVKQRHLVRSGVISKGLIYNYTHRHTMPAGYILQRLCSSLDVSADYLLGLKEEDTPCS